MAPRPSAPPAPSPSRPWSSRLAWGLLLCTGLAVGARVLVATVVQIHGDGMAPTLVDGDYVLLVRGRWSVDAGDVVVYRAPATTVPAQTAPPPVDTPSSPNHNGREFPDVTAKARRTLRNTAVVDPDELGDELDDNWEQVQNRSETGLAAAGSYRVGRVLALPGDRVHLERQGSNLALVVEGETIIRKEGGPLRIRLRDRDGAELTRANMAWESGGERRWAILDRGPDDSAWQGLNLGPTDLIAPGYLVLADNRPEGACCDSRALGWIPPERLRGEVVIRMAGDPSATPDLDPAARGFKWKP